MPKIDDDTYDDDGFGVDVMMLMVMMMCWWWWYGGEDDDDVDIYIMMKCMYVYHVFVNSQLGANGAKRDAR